MTILFIVGLYGSGIIYKGYIRRDPAKNRAIEIIDDSFGLQRRKMVNVPLVGRVAAGEPILAVENIETYFPVPAEYMPNKQSFMLKVKGESMIMPVSLTVIISSSSSRVEQ